MDLIREMFQYPFMVRAMIVGTAVSLCAALVGVSLVLKRYSMIGDGLSHVGFGALALATALNAQPLEVTMPVVVISAIFLLRLSEKSKVRGDAAIALVSTAALAIGVMIISMTTGMNTDVCNYLFGSILSMSVSDVRLSIGLCIFIFMAYIIFYNRIFLITFDESFAEAIGAKPKYYNMILAILTAMIIVLGMRMMGALLISNLIVIPALSAMRICGSFKKVVVTSAIVSIICLWAGMVVSYIYATPTGASIVICNLIVFIVFYIAGALRGVRSL